MLNRNIIRFYQLPYIIYVVNGKAFMEITLGDYEIEFITGT